MGYKHERKKNQNTLVFRYFIHKRPNVSTMVFLQLVNTFSKAEDFKINT